MRAFEAKNSATLFPYFPQNLAHCEKSLSCSGDKYYYGPLKNVSRLLAGCYSSSSIWLHHFPKAIEMTSSSPINTALLLLFLYYYYHSFTIHTKRGDHFSHPKKVLLNSEKLLPKVLSFP